MALPIPMWWLEFDFRLAAQKRIQKASKSGEDKGLGMFTEEQWAEARRRHREKMNGK